MTSVASRSPLTDEIVALLRDQCPFPVGDGAPPSLPEGVQRLDPAGAFAIVYELDGTPTSEGWSGSGAAMVSVVYQISAMGIQRDQASMACDMIAELLVGKTGGVFTHPLAVTGHTVMDRTIRSFMPMQAEGTFQTGFYLVCELAIV